MKKFTLIFALGLLISCTGFQTTEEPVKAPEIYSNMPLEKAVSAAMEFGGKTLRQVKKLIKRKKAWPEASKIVYNRINANFEAMTPNQFVGAMHLYMSWPQYGQTELFRKMVKDDRPMVRQLGWQLASVVRNKKMGLAVQDVLDKALENNNIDQILVSQMANTVERHQMKESYTLMRMGLFKTDHEDFAKAMISLDPVRSSADFMDYLAQADKEELRQMTLSSINIYSALLALKHMKNFPVEISHQKIGHLFLYSISRNQALLELSVDLLKEYVPANTDHMAHKLSLYPGWVQLAFVEGARRRMTPKIGLILSELKFITSQRDVIDEIAMLRR
jgi:hypothetical protein